MSSQSDADKLIEIAQKAVFDELRGKIDSINFKSWLNLISLICEAVDKRKELTGSQKKDIALKAIREFVGCLGVSDEMVRMIIENGSHLIDEVVAISKGIYEINTTIKKSGILQKCFPCLFKKNKSTTTATPTTTKKTEELTEKSTEETKKDDTSI